MPGCADVGAGAAAGVAAVAGVAVAAAAAGGVRKELGRGAVRRPERERMKKERHG